MSATGRTTPPPRDGGLYIHVPFCNSLCAYCHFCRTDRHDAELRRRYVDAVCREFALRDRKCGLLTGANARVAATCYVGGGTPSCLEPDLFVELLAGTWGRVQRAPDAEVTAEANPESLTPDTAEAWCAAGVNRVSLGVQSFDPDVLAWLGRACGPETAREALRLAGRVFTRVSADWILAQGCEAGSLRDAFAEARDLGVGHVSLYILELHAGTPLAADVNAGRRRLDEDAVIERTYLEAVDALAGLGFAQYEVSNFCLPGQASRHNGAYWRRAPYLGLGAGAHGYWGRWRYANYGDLRAYLQAVGEDRFPEASWEMLDPAARRLEGVILPLRTATGVDLGDLDVSAAWLSRGEGEGLWRIVDGRLCLTARGMLRIDDVEARLVAVQSCQ